MRKAQLVSEILGEFLFPILGFLFWDWDLYFVLLFILFDYTIRLLFAFFRPQTRSLKHLLRPLIFFLTFSVTSHFYMVLTEPTWRFVTAFSDFFWYQDFYIPQGLLVVPLLIYTENSRQKMVLMTTGVFDAIKQLKKTGARLLYGTLIFMLMSIGLALFSWGDTVEISFFLVSWLGLILIEHKGAFLKA